MGTAEAALLAEVWQAIHIRRLDFHKKPPKAGGPDNFYNGVIHSRDAVLDVAERHGVSEQDIYAALRTPDGG